MCFGGGKPSVPSTPAPVTPAPAPAPAEPAPTETSLTAARQGEEDATFGTKGPTTRVDRSAQGGVAGGSGLNI